MLGTTRLHPDACELRAIRNDLKLDKSFLKFIHIWDLCRNIGMVGILHTRRTALWLISQPSYWPSRTVAQIAPSIDCPLGLQLEEECGYSHLPKRRAYRYIVIYKLE